MTNQKNIVLHFDYLPCVNYAALSCGVETCNTFIIENHDTKDWHNIKVTVSGEKIEEHILHIDSIRKMKSIQLQTIKIAPNINALVSLTEAVNTTFSLKIEQEGELLWKKEYPICLLAFDQWTGGAIMPELIAAFVVPNNPLLSRVLVNAGKKLEKLTGSSALDEYQTQDRNRVRHQVAAVYEALRSEGIVYCTPPARFEDYGQRIRLVDQVLTEKLGTCIDTSLLMASCLEQIGINPILVFLQEHAFVGAWLTPSVYPRMIGDDASLLNKELADGNNNLVLIETTCITSSSPVSFEDAVLIANQKIREEQSFLYFVDIHRCRLSHIHPLPQRVKVDGEWQVPDQGLKHEDVTTGISSLNHYDLRLENTGKELSKQLIWERKLLDFSLRNNLLNMRVGRRAVPFISFEIDHLEDHLQNAEDYRITPCPDTKIQPGLYGIYDSVRQASQHQGLVSEFIKQNKIVSYLTDTELQDALKYIYRTARTSLEENGANSLFLSLGILKWYENPKSEQPRFAPILLLPVDIVRKTASNYVIRKRDEDIFLNITLVEFLKQNFEIDLGQLLQGMPKDENGVDVKYILTFIRRAIIDQKRWDVLEESLLGLFSFNKFVMWNDIHTHADAMKENPVIASLMEQCNKLDDNDERVDARVIDQENKPMDFAIPLDVDSSQFEAVVESGKGKSFILQGPPGTGKSQTITNMIANALFQGKRVLFVAEKMAALSVVQSRLEKIGLGAFCLELHSNKVTKKHFLEQMDKVLNVTKIQQPEVFSEESDALFAERKALIAYMQAIHSKTESGISIYDALSEYLGLDCEEIDATGLPREMLDASKVKYDGEAVQKLQTILNLTDTIKGHPLEGLEPVDNRQATLDEIKDVLNKIIALKQKYGDQLSITDDEPRRVAFEKHIQLNNDKEATLMSIRAICSEDICTEDVKQLKQLWDEIQMKWFLPRYFAERGYLRRLRQYGDIRKADVYPLLQAVKKYQDCHKELATSNIDLEEATRLIDIYNLCRDQLSRLEQHTYQCPAFSVVAAKANDWLNAFPHIKDWCLWIDEKHTLISNGLSTVVARLEQGAMPADAFNAFIKGIYHRIITENIDVNPQLRTFNGLLFNQQVEKYKRDTKRFQELSKEVLYSRLASQVPSVAVASSEGSEISILKRNINNGGRGTSIRAIIDSIPTLLPRLCPCMLMSPLSVAQFLDLGTDKFDLVIFDEASQMPTSEAVGAIARGNALICVGDSKQMPPTSFFTSTQVDEEEADLDDMESILDDCNTLSIKEYQLNWHYRSKHESLIAFSNIHYYDNHLLTFPSVDDREVKVKMVKINGVYDKGKTRSNPDEAKAIVAEVMRRLQDPELRKRSIGIISFSKVQQNLIEDKLFEELDKNPELKEFATNAEEPIFIKNLENVQGDERDIILFSVGYGPDKFGKVSMNFGPLNNAGGERRLNVAVSRARYEMLVFSTLSSGQIDLRRSNAKGVAGLKYFLEFAENGLLPNQEQDAASAKDNVLIDQIADAIRQEGYLATTNIGRSHFKIDIAVSTEEDPKKYILCILCDGKNYYETKTTRDREIVQPSVLHMLKWNTMRVYSIDWYENKGRVVQQIMDELKSIEQNEDMQDIDEPQPVKSFSVSELQSAPEEPATKNAAMQPYVEAESVSLAVNKDNFNPQNSKVKSIVRNIIKTEQPICQNYLCKRLAKALGFGHAGPNIQATVTWAASSCYLVKSDIGSDYYFVDKKSAEGYNAYRGKSPRTISEIPQIEIVNAILEVVSEEFSLPQDKIPTLAAKKLGFASAAAKIRESINAVISILSSQNRILIKGDNVSFQKVPNSND